MSQEGKINGTDVLSGILYTCVGDVTAEAVRWLWPGRIPLGELTMIVGDPGLGKSQVTASLAAVVTTGGQWPVSRERAERGSVLILSAEDNVKHTIRPRLDAAGADVHRCYVLQAVRRPGAGGVIQEATFSLASDLARLDAILAHIGDVRLVIIDPVSAYLGDTDSHKNAEVRGLLAPLSALAGAHTAAFVLVSHLTKSQSTGNALMRVQGSVAFAALCRAVWGVARDRANPERRLFMPMKNNLGADSAGLAYSVQAFEIPGSPPIPTSRVMWEPEPVDAATADAFGAPLSQEEQGELEDAKAFLRATLKDGRLRVTEIQGLAKGAGLTITTLGRAKRGIGVRSIPEGGGAARVWYWELPLSAEPTEAGRTS